MFSAKFSSLQIRGQRKNIDEKTGNLVPCV